MKKLIKTGMLMIAVSLFSSYAIAQDSNFENGEKAYLEGRYNEALKLLTQAVYHDKFEMKGKDIPLAYAYMALIRIHYLESKLQNGTIETIQSNPGLIKMAVTDLISANEFHDKGSSSLVNKAHKKLTSNALMVGRLLTDSIQKLNFELNPNACKPLATTLIFELKDLSNIEEENWEFHDMIGLSYYIMEDFPMAMLSYKRARDIYNKTEAKELSNLHFYNCVFSAKYHFKESKNYVESYEATVDGKLFIARMMQQADANDIQKLKELSSLEGTFSGIQNRIENMNVLSSNKE